MQYYNVYTGVPQLTKESAKSKQPKKKVKCNGEAAEGNHGKKPKGNGKNNETVDEECQGKPKKNGKNKEAADGDDAEEVPEIEPKPLAKKARLDESGKHTAAKGKAKPGGRAKAAKAMAKKKAKAKASSSKPKAKAKGKAKAKVKPTPKAVDDDDDDSQEGEEEENMEDDPPVGDHEVTRKRRPPLDELEPVVTLEQMHVKPEVIAPPPNKADNVTAPCEKGVMEDKSTHKDGDSQPPPPDSQPQPEDSQPPDSQPPDSQPPAPDSQPVPHTQPAPDSQSAPNVTVETLHKAHTESQWYLDSTDIKIHNSAK